MTGDGSAGDKEGGRGWNRESSLLLLLSTKNSSSYGKKEEAYSHFPFKAERHNGSIYICVCAEGGGGEKFALLEILAFPRFLSTSCVCVEKKEILRI